MKRTIAVLTALALVAFATASLAGDYHTGSTLFCQQCHVAHGSQQHAYNTTGGTFVPVDPTGAPHEYLLRAEPNLLCLSCHDNNDQAPDVFGVNTGESPSDVRQAGALNSADDSKLSNQGNYETIDGHSLWSMDDPPGKGTSTYAPDAEGLECISCHTQHGSTAYRNLLYRGLFAGDTLNYMTGTNNTDYWVYQRSALQYDVSKVDFNEPDPTQSRYAQWCQDCHQDFHGQGGDPNMGGVSGGYATASPPWKRHPTADVNLGHTGEPTYVASLDEYLGHTNKVKMMSTSGTWTLPVGTATSDLTPSCFSCHKAHGNLNAFGLIFMEGSGTMSEEGDGTLYKDLCRQCHIQG